MFQYRRRVHRPSKLQGALVTLELIFHQTVRATREQNTNAVVALVKSIIRAVLLVLVFYFIFSMMGMKRAAVRGDFMLFMISGVMPFMTHIQSVNAIFKSQGPLGGLMAHAPMSTAITIISTALSALYIQSLTMFTILFIYHALLNPITIEEPVQAYALYLLAWFSGCAIGLMFLSIGPWLPTIAATGSMLYRRSNMIASGKMMAANFIPNIMLPMFIWNPLFHIIDQLRGHVFLNYTPRLTNWQYPLYLSLTFVILGMMGEFFIRRNLSKSMFARR